MVTQYSGNSPFEAGVSVSRALRLNDKDLVIAFDEDGSELSTITKEFYVGYLNGLEESEIN